MNAYRYLALAIIAFLTACSGTQPTPDSAINTINAVYLPVRTLAALCAAGIKPCQDPNVSANVGKAIPLADAAVAEAIKAIRANPDQSNASKWSSYAMSAIDILAKALATYGVKG